MDTVLAVSVVDAQNCTLTINHDLSEYNFIQTTLCCHDYDNPLHSNYPACILYDPSMKIFCGATVNYRHFLNPNTGYDDVIEPALRDMIIQAYENADKDATIAAFNDNDSHYPELHYISGNTISNESIIDFSGFSYIADTS